MRSTCEGHGQRSATASEAGFPSATEFLSLYTSESHDHSWATLTVPFRPLAHIRWPARFILMLTLVPVIMAGVVDFDDPAELLTAVSLLTFPTTFVVTLLWLREKRPLRATPAALEDHLHRLDLCAGW